jgi:hypothetical protein
MDGAAPANLGVHIQTEAPDVTTYAFVLPNGDRMLALWTDGAAVDEDPGVPATLTFTGRSAEVRSASTCSRASSRRSSRGRSRRLVIDELLDGLPDLRPP